MKMSYVFASAIIFCLLTPKPTSADCVCTVYPIFPYSGNNWMHYANKNTGDCIVDYPTSHIQAYTPSPEYCVSATDSGTCTSLGSTVSVAGVVSSELHFGGGSPPSYAALDEASEIKEFLKNNMNVVDPAAIIMAKNYYDNCEFASQKGTKPPVVKLVRNVAGSEEVFYAVLWKMRPKTRLNGEDRWGYIGVEISGAGGATVWAPSGNTYRASVRAKDGDFLQDIIVKGVLEVQIGAETDAEVQVYYIRLHSSAKNKVQTAFPSHSLSTARTIKGLKRPAREP